jgi:hypothetical protein
VPVKIGPIEDLADDEFQALRRKKGARADPAMVELLDRVESGTPQRVGLEPGQNARGLRFAIARKAKQRGLGVETVEGDGFVAVSRTDAPPTRTGRPAPTDSGQRRRGRPPKQQPTKSEAEADGLSKAME